MNKNIKNERGVISVFTMLAMLFFLLFIIGSYMAISRSNRVQNESNEELLKLYSNDISAQSIYDEMIASAYDVIPIYLNDQVGLIGGNCICANNGKLYYYGKDKNYELKTNMNLSKNAIDNGNEEIDDARYSYVNKRKMVVNLDGINNTGNNSHDKNSSTTVWKNLCRTTNKKESEFDYFKMCNSSNAPLPSGAKWENGCLHLAGGGKGLYGDVLIAADEETFKGQTFEMVIKTSSDSSQRLIGNWKNGMGLSIKDGYLLGEVAVKKGSKTYILNVEDDTRKIKTNAITHVAMTYNGSLCNLYVNGNLVTKTKLAGLQLDGCSVTTLPMKSANGGFLGMEVDLSGNNYVVKPVWMISSSNTISKISYKYDNDAIIEGTSCSKSAITMQGKHDVNFRCELSNGYIVHFGKLEDYNHDNNHNVSIGNANVTDQLIVVANGSNSVILKSNIGRLSNLYMNGTQLASDGYEEHILTINGSEEYFYVIKNLKSSTKYQFTSNVSVDNLDGDDFQIFGDDGFLSSNIERIYIGKSEDNEFGGSAGGYFQGNIYSVRVYDDLLTPDNIKENYKIDKNRFSINQ